MPACRLLGGPHRHAPSFLQREKHRYDAFEACVPRGAQARASSAQKPWYTRQRGRHCTWMPHPGLALSLINHVQALQLQPFCPAQGPAVCCPAWEGGCCGGAGPAKAQDAPAGPSGAWSAPPGHLLGMQMLRPLKLDIGNGAQWHFNKACRCFWGLRSVGVRVLGVPGAHHLMSPRTSGRGVPRPIQTGHRVRAGFPLHSSVRNTIECSGLVHTAWA